MVHSLRLRVLSTAVSSAIHELNQPLTMMNFAADTLMLLAETSSPHLAGDLRELATQIRSGAKRQATILDMLSDLIKNNQTVRPFHLHEFLDTALQLLRPRLCALNFTVQSSFTAQQPILRLPAGCFSFLIFLIFSDAIAEAEQLHSHRKTKLKLIVKTQQLKHALRLVCRYSQSATAKRHSERKAFQQLLESLARELGAHLCVSYPASQSLTSIDIKFLRPNVHT